MMSTTSTIFRLKMCDDNYVPPTDVNLSNTPKSWLVMIILRKIFLIFFRLLLLLCGCLSPFCVTLQLWIDFGKSEITISKLENLYDEYFWQAYVWNKKCLTIFYVWTSFTPTKKFFYKSCHFLQVIFNLLGYLVQRVVCQTSNMMDQLARWAFRYLNIIFI